MTQPFEHLRPALMRLDPLRLRPAPPHRSVRRLVNWDRDAQEMASLLISAIIGAVVTGGIASLLMLSGPALASLSQEPQGDQFVPFTGLQIPALPPVCTCILPDVAD